MKAGACIAVFGLVLAVANAPAQVRQPHRFTVEQQPGKPTFSVISLGRQGLALIRDKDDYKAGQKLFELVLLDTALQKTWASDLDVNNRLQLVGYDFVASRISLLFREGESAESNFELLTLSVKDHTIARYKIRQDVNFKLTHFSATTHTIILGGYISNEPSVLIYRPEDGQLKVVPGFFLSGMELLDVRVNENYTFNILISARMPNNQRKLVLRTFDEDGVQLLEDEIELPAGFVPLSGITSTLVRPDLAIIGTYAIGKNRTSTGIYFTLADPDKQQPIQFIEYDRIPHFLDHLPARKANKIKQQAARDRLRGQASSFRASVLPLRLAESEKGFALLVETYQASSAMNANPHTNPYNWGNPMNPLTGFGWAPFTSRYYAMPYSFYDPSPTDLVYKTIAAQAVVLGNAGEVLADLHLALSGDQQTTLEQASDFLFNSQTTAILYKKEDELYATFSAHTGELSRADTVRIELSRETEEVRNESDYGGGVRWWFQDSFYCWGLQTVRDRDKQTEDRTRYVFYINRVDARL